MNNDKISVIIPVYNAEKYLKECLESILQQTYTNLEIICINDGSTDRSNDILNSYLNKDSRIKIIRTENKGVSNARNQGIQHVTGKYIAFIDSDDYVSDNYLEELLNSLKKNESDLAVCSIQNFDKIDSLQEINVLNFDFKNPNLLIWYELIFNYLLFGPCNKLYKSKIIKKGIVFDKDLFYGEDLVFNFDYLKYTNKISCTNKALYFYRHDSLTSLSKKYRKNRYQNELVLHNKMMKVMQEKKVLDSKIKIYLYNRIFDTAYNSIIEIVNNESYINQYKMINKILHNCELKKSFRLNEFNDYSRLLMFLMKNRLTLILLIWLNIRIK